MSPSFIHEGNVEPVTERDAAKLEAAYRRAIDGFDAQTRAEKARLALFERIACWVLECIPSLLMLAGGVCFLVAVWGQSLLTVGCALLIAGTAISIWERW